MPDPDDARELAADGDHVLDGCDPPTLEEQLEHLQAAGWPPAPVKP